MKTPIGFAVRGFQKHERLPVPRGSAHRQNPQVTVRLRIDAEIQEEAAVRGPTRGSHDLGGAEQQFFHSSAACDLEIQIPDPRPERLVDDPRSVGRPDGKEVSSGIEREAAGACAVQQPEILVALHCAVHGHDFVDAESRAGTEGQAVGGLYRVESPCYHQGVEKTVGRRRTDRHDAAALQRTLAAVRRTGALVV